MAEQTKKYVVHAAWVSWVERDKDGKDRYVRHQRGRTVELTDDQAVPLLERGRIYPVGDDPPPEPEPAPERRGPQPAGDMPDPVGDLSDGLDESRADASRAGETEGDPVEAVPADYAELLALRVTDLHDLAAKHGIEVSDKDRKDTLARKLADSGVVFLSDRE